MQLRVEFTEQSSGYESSFGLDSELDPHRSAAFRTLAGTGVLAVRQVREEAERGLRGPRSLVAGRLKEPSVEWLLEQVESSRVLDDPPVRLHQPGGVSVQLWPLQDILKAPSGDVIARVRFTPPAGGQRFHSHDHSDRCVLILQGRGTLRTLDESAESQEPSSRALGPGDVVLLPRGLAHLFVPGPERVEALVWHCPYVTHGNPGYLTLRRVAG